MTEDIKSSKILKIRLKAKLQYCGTIFQCSIDQTSKSLMNHTLIYLVGSAMRN